LASLIHTPTYAEVFEQSGAVGLCWP